ncbi:MAG TPA: hypothetical protein VF662_01185 [Allosphingosinicella sp.]|jgi:hypothetical protein
MGGLLMTERRDGAKGRSDAFGKDETSGIQGSSFEIRAYLPPFEADHPRLAERLRGPTILAFWILVSVGVFSVSIYLILLQFAALEQGLAEWAPSLIVVSGYALVQLVDVAFSAFSLNARLRRLTVMKEKMWREDSYDHAAA